MESLAEQGVADYDEDRWWHRVMTARDIQS